MMDFLPPCLARPIPPSHPNLLRFKRHRENCMYLHFYPFLERGARPINFVPPRALRSSSFPKHYATQCHSNNKKTLFFPRTVCLRSGKKSSDMMNISYDLSSEKSFFAMHLLCTRKTHFTKAKRDGRAR